MENCAPEKQFNISFENNEKKYIPKLSRTHFVNRNSRIQPWMSRYHKATNILHRSDMTRSSLFACAAHPDRPQTESENTVSQPWGAIRALSLRRWAAV